ncbi:MAG: hypothetical protein AB8V23_03415 [Candidatus Midichloria sp.]|uniref:VCBS repeat containing protein n=1 Tax=Hyalomma marginatum TaxID=34627 RepID=A0A8S4BUT7_9ACAR|nr:VCBS repeat containing protein [Hyalomma marginatum]CAG7592803.1 VCBS repeat containing protein [Hyalomma marginatum]
MGNIFSLAAKYDAGSSTHGAAIGDFNQDGKLDLTSANYGSNTISALLRQKTIARCKCAITLIM